MTGDNSRQLAQMTQIPSSVQTQQMVMSMMAQQQQGGNRGVVGSLP